MSKRVAVLNHVSRFIEPAPAGANFTLPPGGSDAVAAGEGQLDRKSPLGGIRVALPARSSRPSQREGDF